MQGGRLKSIVVLFAPPRLPLANIGRDIRKNFHAAKECEGEIVKSLEDDDKR